MAKRTLSELLKVNEATIEKEEVRTPHNIKGNLYIDSVPVPPVYSLHIDSVPVPLYITSTLTLYRYPLYIGLLLVFTDCLELFVILISYFLLLLVFS